MSKPLDDLKKWIDERRAPYETVSLDQALASAIKRNDVAAIKQCVNDGASLSGVTINWNQSALHIAAEEGHVDAINALLTLRKELLLTTDVFHALPLHIAACKGHVDAINTLLAWGSKEEQLSVITFYHDTPLQVAAS